MCMHCTEEYEIMDFNNLCIHTCNFVSGFLWLYGKHLVQAVPFVYAFQCLTGKMDK